MWVKKEESTAAFEELFRFDQLNYKNGEVGEILSADPQVTDARLIHLKGLTNLETLELGDTKITDAGLVHLKGLTNLQELSLHYTQVTDAGLVNLKGLTKLKMLNLGNTHRVRRIRWVSRQSGCGPVRTN